ncbi:phospholipase D-like domain-containing protein [Acidithiobacillus ferriphilus]|uniref:phospholipase D-like domain-containing protein n=1 Tax=Acidithiobacillus ferriphilus TaxID=1689834 RepID=UPI00232BD4CE|nr:phospholipase D-like domain-containing protein [Acidithiobacillus ferriphilus]WCE92930.1 phospholipase D-like domain-containing protein [Acidithiobacillus ferriphilus]
MLYMEPQAGVAPIIQLIDSARHHLTIDGYLVDDGAILRAIAQAHARGVNVQVMISGKPYGLPAAQVRHEGTGLCTSGARGLSRRRGENSWGAAAAWDGHDRGRGTGLLPANIDASDRRHVETLGHYGVQVRLLPVKPHYLYTKAFCAANECFIGSVNLSDVSFNDNRELGLLLDGRDVGILERQFDHDWAIAD